MTIREGREIATRANFTGRLQQAAAVIGSLAGVVSREAELGVIERSEAIEVYDELRLATQAILRALQKCQRIRCMATREDSGRNDSTNNQPTEAPPCSTTH